ncbi:2OG-Fe dioxygenase family protein [Nitratireductor sp. XY-223]|uniref:2OG-Fe dioxygenase family protein n=1 Tax=Nitratireductor sp. XY-223 TaxID=2561926 RepID=UPI0010AAD1DD|nr:2OG-Fe dioxygenase family protein [Nitratireductor sp. XY-223]
MNQHAVSSNPIPQPPFQIVSQLQQSGYARIGKKQIGRDDSFNRALNLLERQFEKLPSDTPAATSRRFRSICGYTLLPSGHLLPGVVANDLQPVRFFDYYPYASKSCQLALGQNAQEKTNINNGWPNNPALKYLIAFDHQLLPKIPDWRDHPLQVFVQLLRYAPTSGAPAIARPNCFHQDGCPFLFHHHVKSQNVSGGCTVLADPSAVERHPCDVPEESIRELCWMEQPLDSLAIADQRIAHHSSLVEIDREGEDAYRDVLIIQFSPQTTDHSYTIN